MNVIGAFSEGGFRLGLLVAAFWFGFRHGIDWDHIAAITDITSSQEERRQALIFGTLYALGHASVVLVLGILAILVGEQLPAGVDNVMTRIVGATLILLGVYVFVSLIRHGRDFRLRSRWMLVFAGVRKGVRWAKRRSRAGGNGATPGLETEPANAMVGDGEVEVPSWHHGHHGRPGHHHHSRPEPDDTFMTYGRATAFGVGMIHGVGAETPTQVLIFLSAAGAGGTGVGILVLLSFIVGLLASNTMITLGSAFGYLRASKNFPIYAGVAIVTGVFSLAIGALFLFGKTTLLPALFGG
jgi:ABC-type nickel/cobalt efflux system permease component RcnA